jgi:hypothetical protein
MLPSPSLARRPPNVRTGPPHRPFARFRDRESTRPFSAAILSLDEVLLDPFDFAPHATVALAKKAARIVASFAAACTLGGPAGCGPTQTDSGGTAPSGSSSGQSSSGATASGSAESNSGSSGNNESSGSSGTSSSGTASGSSTSGQSPASGSSMGASGMATGGLGDASAGTGQGTPEETDGGEVIGPGPAGCANPLGSVWHVTEASNHCASTWTRQGSSAMFAYVETAPCNVTATVTVTLSDVNVTAFWTTSSDNDDCNYLGTLNSNCTMIMGTYTCNSSDAGSGAWTVAIQ